MILLDDKQVEALQARRAAEEEQLQQEPPPTYASLEASSTTTSSSTCTPAALKPANYISITRVHGNIKEAFTLDPALYIPAFLLPPLVKGETEEGRRNLRLEATHGYVYAKVRLLPNKVVGEDEGRLERDGGKGKRRVTMVMKSIHGGITAKVLSTPNRPRFHLHAQSTNGNVQIHVPRTFHGPITVNIRHGSLKFSDDLSEHLTTFGDVNGTRTCFVGDFSSRADVKHGWQGDEIVVEARHGGVRIQYEDDCAGAAVRSRPGFLHKVFGF